MKKVILASLLMLSLNTFAQHKHNLDRTPIADETEVAETKTKYKVITCSDEVYLRIMREYSDSVETVIMKPNKKDRKGKYTEYVVYFKLELKPKIEAFLKKL